MSNRIMVVEDHDAVRHALRDWLALSVPDCRIIESNSGEKAIEVAKTESPEVIIMDISLPKMDGIEATRQIKAILPETKIIILSIHEDASYRNSAALAGACAYIPKRIMKIDLLSTIHACISGRENGNE
jgi:DNA-binding NarL/FixJ family response regulator